MTGSQAAEAAVRGAEAVVLGERVDPARGTRTPLTEQATIGAATGMALGGKRVVVELVDPAGVARAADALADAGSVRARSSGAWAAPVVIRVPLAAGTSVPAVPAGVAVRIVGRAAQLGPVLVAALAAEGPTVVFEAEGVTGKVDEAPLPDGAQLVVLAVGAGVGVAVEAAARLAGEISVGVVDVGGLTLDDAAVAAVRRAGRVVVVGHGGEGLSGSAVAAAFWSLEAPPIEVRAVSGVDAVIAAIRTTIEE